MKLFCLSGFLGLPADWDFLKPLGHSMEAYSPQSFLAQDFKEAAKLINKTAQKSKADFLLGYSLGGRLAMHSLVENPENWKGAIIFSAHPGIEDEAEMQARGEQDIKWAKKFLDLPWDEVMAQWNAQPVFQGSSVLQRDESQFKREELADLLTYFSLGQQDDLRSELRGVDKPVLFVAGDKDKKFSKLAKELTYLNAEAFEMWLVPGVGHRVLGSSPLLLEKIKSFLEEYS